MRRPTLARVRASWRALAVWFEQVEASAWSAAAAWLALGIGLLNLWYSVIRVWWLGRKASPSARLDLLSYQTQSRAWEEEERVVVTNHGPATMKRVTVEALDEDGASLAPGATALWPTMPVEYLHVGQSLYLKLERSAANRRPSVADLAWRDNRWRKQSRSVDLTYNRVL
jgi:hypothetical protein